MEIYILRDGKETGPYSEDETQRMLKQGDALISDLAWTKGMTEWIPLHAVLYPAGTGVVESVAAVTPPLAGEPATARQKAFLSYIGQPIGSEITKEQAALLVNDAMENPRDPARLARWNDDRLKLHPDLFAEEIQARKEQRAARFFELAKGDGAKCVEGVTKAHSQVLVNYLDGKFPNWDANETEALWNYFLPAVNDKFPQLIRKEWKGKLSFPQSPKAVPVAARRRPTAVAKAKGPSPFMLVVRGVAIGLILLGAGIAVIYLQQHPEERENLRKQGEALVAKFSKPARTGISMKSGPASPSSESPAPGANDTAAAPTVSEGEPDTPDARVAASMEPRPDESSADAPVAAALPPPPMPVEPSAPAGTDSLFGPPTTPSPQPNAGMTEAEPAASLLPGPKTHVTLTEPVKIETPYGPMEFKPGMKFPLVGQEGVDVTVRFQGRMIDIPASATDLVSDAPAP